MTKAEQPESIYETIRERAALMNRLQKQEQGTSIRIHDIATELHCTDELILESLEFVA